MAARHLGILHHEVAVLTTDGHLEVELDPPARLGTGFHHNRWQPLTPRVGERHHHDDREARSLSVACQRTLTSGRYQARVPFACLPTHAASDGRTVAQPHPATWR